MWIYIHLRLLDLLRLPPHEERYCYKTVIGFNNLLNVDSIVWSRWINIERYITGWSEAKAGAGVCLINRTGISGPIEFIRSSVSNSVCVRTRTRHSKTTRKWRTQLLHLTMPLTVAVFINTVVANPSVHEMRFHLQKLQSIRYKRRL